jgi:hypothetical protein
VGTLDFFCGVGGGGAIRYVNNRLYAKQVFQQELKG